MRGFLLAKNARLSALMKATLRRILSPFTDALLFFFCKSTGLPCIFQAYAQGHIVTFDQTLPTIRGTCTRVTFAAQPESNACDVPTIVHLSSTALSSTAQKGRWARKLRGPLCKSASDPHASLHSTLHFLLRGIPFFGAFSFASPLQLQAFAPQLRASDVEDNSRGGEGRGDVVSYLTVLEKSS